MPDLESAESPVTPAAVKRRDRLLRPVYFVLGLVCLALGVIGAFVPLMPSTIFLILAAWAFARSSTRLEVWLMQHRQFGPVLQAWQRERAIPRRAKLMACLGMTLGLLLFFLSVHPEPWLLALVALLLLGCAAYVVSRPEPRL